MTSSMCHDLLRWCYRFIEKISRPDAKHLSDPDKS